MFPRLSAALRSIAPVRPGVGQRSKQADVRVKSEAIAKHVDPKSRVDEKTLASSKGGVTPVENLRER